MKKMFGRPATSAAGGGTSAPPAPAPGTSIASQIGFGKTEDKKEGKKGKKAEDPKKEDQPLCGAPMDKADKTSKPKNPIFGPDHSEDKQTEQTDPQKYLPKPGNKPSSRKDQERHEGPARAWRTKMREQGVLKAEVKETKGIGFDKPAKSDKEKEQRKRPMEKCGDIEVGAKKTQKSDTCGIMKREKGVEKLSNFLAKGEKKIH
jgi:hypothetical protein